MSYRIGICDDEIYQIKINNLYLKEIAKKNNYNFECYGFDSKLKVLKYLMTNQLDILFLDIELGVGSGLSLAAEISAKYPDIVIIFITGYREYANEAFEIEAMGYVVKPIEIKKLERILKKAISQVEGIKSQKVIKTLVITHENLKKKINQFEIIYIQRQQSKSVIFTQKNHYYVYETISSLFSRLDNSFMRVNQSEIVNIAEVSEIKNNCVILKNGISMPIGRTFRKDIINTYFNTP